MLKTGGKTKVDAWMKNTATEELQHTDSILKNYTISDIYVQVVLLRMRSMCYFIKADWKNLQYADTVFRSIAEAYGPYKKAGITELAAYAKAKLEPMADFNKSYVSFFTRAMKPLTEDESEYFTGSAIKEFRDANDVFESQLEKITASPSVADTLLYQLFHGYVYRQIDPVIRELLTAYLNESIKEKFKRADTLRGSITLKERGGMCYTTV